MMVTGIILLAGNSTRYKKGYNKNFEYLDNLPIIYYSINTLNNNNLINDIILVVRKEDLRILRKIIGTIKLKKEIKFVLGGNTRNESVYNAITSTNSDIVLIHDGARPLIKDEYITNGIQAILDGYKGACTAIRVKDTIKVCNSNSEIVSSTNRQYTYRAQTPQTFDRELLLNLHEKYQNNSSLTDDCSYLELDGYKVKLIPGDISNIKITTDDDLDILNGFVKKVKKRGIYE